jgi:hypothetical protein
MGAITSPLVQKQLAALTQVERDKALRAALQQLYPKMLTYSAKLGERKFTIVGEKTVTENIAKDQTFESSVNAGLTAVLRDKGGHFERSPSP